MNSNKPKIMVSWSGGKDSALALYALLQNDTYKIAGLFTVLTSKYNRISLHGISCQMLEYQAKAIGLPLYKIFIPPQCDNAIYEDKMQRALLDLRDKGITAMAFGDIHLEWIKPYREERLAKTGIKGIFPLWGKDPKQLAKKFCSLGFISAICCIDLNKLSEDRIETLYDQDFISQLPNDVDCCGENGEFHSFVFAGPIFKHRLNIKFGKKIIINNYYYRDIYLQRD